MSRAIVIVLALVATVSAERYAYNQVDELVSRLWTCLQVVPQEPSSFYTPASYCMVDARGSINSYGTPKETFASSIPKCLTKRQVPAGIVSTAQQCLTEAVAQDLPAPMKKAFYSSKQWSEIGDRIFACLPSPPALETRWAEYCRDKALWSEPCPKEYLVNFVVPCLTSKNVEAAAVETAQTCIAESLAQPLSK